MKFIDLKNEIVARAKTAKACSDEYKRAIQSNSYSELMTVIKDNFNFAVKNKVIDKDLIESWKEHFNANKIYCNENVSNGYLLAYGDSTVEAHGRSTVIAYGNSTVKSYGSSKVIAYDNSTVGAYSSSNVEARGNSTVKAYYYSTVGAYGDSTVIAQGRSTVKAYGNSTVGAYGSSTVEAHDNSKVIAYGNSYIFSDSMIECKLNDYAIHRITGSKTILYASDLLVFRKKD